MAKRPRTPAKPPKVSSAPRPGTALAAVLQRCRPTPASLLFQGREDDPRWGQWVQPFTASVERLGITDCVLYGCPSDDGVRRNRGRAGAANGPEATRRHLYKLALPDPDRWRNAVAFYDAGDAIIEEFPIQQAHKTCRAIAGAIAATGATLLPIGGGHDFAAPNISGLRDALGPKARLGVLNVDPHLDMRPWEDGEPHSGTPFRTLLDEKIVEGARMVVFGMRVLRNAAAHVSYAQEHGVTLVPMEPLLFFGESVIQRFASELQQLSDRCDVVAVTVDIDCCSDAEGSSAAPVLGFRAEQLAAFAYAAGRDERVRYFEIAEVAPTLDTNERSARIAAELCAAFVAGRASARRSNSVFLPEIVRKSKTDKPTQKKPKA